MVDPGGSLGIFREAVEPHKAAHGSPRRQLRLVLNRLFRSPRSTSGDKGKNKHHVRTKSCGVKSWEQCWPGASPRTAWPENHTVYDRVRFSTSTPKKDLDERIESAGQPPLDSQQFGARLISLPVTCYEGKQYELVAELIQRYTCPELLLPSGPNDVTGKARYVLAPAPGKKLL